MSAEPDRRPSHPVELGDGSTASAVGYESERIELIVDRAYPPGKPLAIALALPDATVALQGKALSSKRRDDARYDVRVKLSSVRREQRALLERAFS